MTGIDTTDHNGPSRRLTPGQLPTAQQAEEIFDAALHAGDARGVDAALRILAVRDPHRAQLLFDILEFACAIAQHTDR